VVRYIKYCRRCVYPETKPDLVMDDEGICNGCRNYEYRVHVDWEERAKELEVVLDQYRSKNSSNYDCIIPVSGGKDSTYQTVMMLERGMNPLCVTASTDKLSEIGRRNIENIKSLGVDYIEISTNPVIRRRINRLALRQIGDIAWPEHVTIYTVPIRVAVQLNIPLVIWGGNPQNELGGPQKAADSNKMQRGWLEEFGGMLGLRVRDLIGMDGIEEKHLIQYTYPTDEEMKKVGVTGLFLGYYLPWDSHSNTLLAQAYGFETYPKLVEGSIVSYENLDNLQMRIHDYFKVLKYGYDRCTDWASLHIRRNRLTRAQAVALVKRYGGKFPWEYLGTPLEEILEDIEMSLDEFIKICDRFTNTKLFKCDARGKLIKDTDGNLTKINDNNVDAQ